MTPAEAEGIKVDELRNKRGLTRGQLAAYSGHSVSYVGLVIKGKRNLSDKTRADFARALGIMPVVLLRARGVIAFDDEQTTVVHETISQMRLSEILTIKYGAVGSEIAEIVELIVKTVAAHT